MARLPVTLCFVSVGPPSLRAWTPKRQLLEIAAREFFDVDSAELDVVDGVVQLKDRPKSNIRIPIEEVMNHFRSADALGQTSSITGRPSAPMPPSSTFARHFAAHFADVEVDIETGEIRLLDWLATQDSGTVVNPQVLKNQMIGGSDLRRWFRPL